MSRIVQIVGLGTHLRDDRSPEKGSCDKLLITCEYPTELITIDGKEVPRFQSKQENVFMNEKANLPKIIKAAIPTFDLDKVDEEGFDVNELLGKGCMTVIGSTASDKPKITAFTPSMKGFDCPPQISESVLFDFYEPDLEVFNGLMAWVQEEIKSADNYKGSILEGMIDGGAKEDAGMEPSADIPF